MAAASQRRLRVVGLGFMLGTEEERADLVHLLTHATLLIPAVGPEKLNAKAQRAMVQRFQALRLCAFALSPWEHELHAAPLLGNL